MEITFEVGLSWVLLESAKLVSALNFRSSCETAKFDKGGIYAWIAPLIWKDGNSKNNGRSPDLFDDLVWQIVRYLVPLISEDLYG